MAVKAFPRAGAFAVLVHTKQVGIIATYPQENPVGTEDKNGKTHPVVTLDPTVCEFHVIDDSGHTVSELRNVAIRDVRQATVREIPAKRRPTAMQAAKYGYAAK